jgi:formylglycine-generating enzyme required for sulfatase activity
MKTQVLLLVVVLLALSNCGPATEPVRDRGQTPETGAVSQPARPTQTISDAPTVATMARVTEVPTSATVARATEVPTPAGPAAGGEAGEGWIRPADGMEMVYVPAGRFEMGSDDPYYNNERPPHPVELAGFWMDRTEVTNTQYQKCVAAGVCQAPAQSGSNSRETYFEDPAFEAYPVIYVSWYRAVAYCQWAGARLPTEEEWEYAARGPENRRYPWGNAPDTTRLNCCDANCPLDHADPGSDDGYADTAPVGSYPDGASWCGVEDLVGNVWEWVWDWYGFYPDEGNPDWLAPDMTARVLRGGSWDTVGDHARCTFRNWFDPAQAYDSVGFRCAYDLVGEGHAGGTASP